MIVTRRVGQSLCLALLLGVSSLAAVQSEPQRATALQELQAFFAGDSGKCSQLEAAFHWLELGEVEHAARFMRRALNQGEALDEIDAALRERMQSNAQGIEQNLLDAIKQEARADLFFAYAIFLKLVERESDVAKAAIYADFLAGGDAQALALIGKDVLRPYLRARRAAHQGRPEAALVELAQVIAETAEADKHEHEGTFASLLMSAGYIESAERRYRALASDPTLRFDLSVPHPQSPWWNLEAVVARLEAMLIDGDQIVGSVCSLVGLTLLGDWDRAFEMAKRLREEGVVGDSAYQELAAYVARAEQAGAHLEAARYRNAFTPSRSIQDVTGLLQAGDFGAAAKLLASFEAEPKEERPHNYYAYVAALFLAQSDTSDAADALAEWIVGMRRDLPLEPRISALIGAERFQQTKTRLQEEAGRDASSTHPRYALCVLLLQEEKLEEAAALLDELELLLGSDSEAYVKLRARLPKAAQGKPEHSPLPADELLRQGDAAFASAQFGLANKRYVQAAQRDIKAAGIERALLRGAFSNADYVAAAGYALDVLELEELSKAEELRRFDLGVFESYRLQKDFSEHLKGLEAYCADHVLDGDAWLLCGLLLLESREAALALPYFSGYMKIAEQPRNDARLFQARAESLAR